MSKSMESRAFERVGTEFFVALCRRQDFEPFDLPAERHGSWEWAFRKHSNELDRFVVIAFTSLPATAPDAHWYTIEIWAGAEKGDRYTRKPVSELRASLESTLQESLHSALRAPILRAMKIADDFAPYDLDEAYVGPRSQVGPKPRGSSSAGASD
jgi:hypothetical protein